MLIFLIYAKWPRDRWNLYLISLGTREKTDRRVNGGKCRNSWHSLHRNGIHIFTSPSLFSVCSAIDGQNEISFICRLFLLISFYFSLNRRRLSLSSTSVFDSFNDFFLLFLFTLCFTCSHLKWMEWTKWHRKMSTETNDKKNVHFLCSFSVKDFFFNSVNVAFYSC